MNRLLSLKPALPEGLQDDDITADTMLVARAPIYGKKDAGRGFWKMLRSDIFGAGLKEIVVMRALYFEQADGDVKVTMVTHVDDAGWASKPSYEHMVDGLLEMNQLKKIERGGSCR